MGHNSSEARALQALETLLDLGSEYISPHHQAADKVYRRLGLILHRKKGVVSNAKKAPHLLRRKNSMNSESKTLAPTPPRPPPPVEPIEGLIKGLNQIKHLLSLIYRIARLKKK